MPSVSDVRPRELQSPMQLQLMSHPFQQMAMDIVGPLEDTQSGSSYILVVCNYFSKWPLYRAVCILRW
ncbi:hypothetical protein T4E_8257 [Trichinella pseudospiralis]|uniref:Uncharacterized protein n=1 Tax=Trichinella pseudospiralis TaxID=6337 RepID=A0A0V0XF51_TRIPS|nr:hypothetical protein T4E_8257 [Trichinella pseudospiralis]